MGLVMTAIRLYSIASIAYAAVTNYTSLCFWLVIFVALLLLIWPYISPYTPRIVNKSCYSQKQIEGFARVKIGANSYKIHEDLQDPIKAAETMDKLNTVAKTLISKMYSKYIDNPNGMDLIKDEHKKIVRNAIKDMKKNFVTSNMEENIPERSGGDTSYVVDKGDVFAMCLRDPKNGNQLDPKFNDLTFVLIHEISHLGCKEWGHPPSFWTLFRFVLQEAVEFELYTSIDYKQVGSPYCGIVISYSPLYDTKLVDYRK